MNPSYPWKLVQLVAASYLVGTIVILAFFRQEVALVPSTKTGRASIVEAEAGWLEAPEPGQKKKVKVELKCRFCGRTPQASRDMGNVVALGP